MVGNMAGQLVWFLDDKRRFKIDIFGHFVEEVVHLLELAEFLMNDAKWRILLTGSTNHLFPPSSNHPK